MRPRRLLWQLFPYVLLTVAAAILAVLWQSTAMWQRFYEQSVADDLLARARILEQELDADAVAADPAATDADLKGLGRRTQTRFTLMDSAGVVLADSDHEPGTMENHALRPEVQAALEGRVGRSVRYSDTLRRRMMYLAVPLQREGRIRLVVRAATPLAGIDGALKSVRKSVLLAAGIVLLLAAGVSYALSRRIARPLEEIRLAAERFAQGDLTARAPLPPSAEMAALARTFNEMAVELDQRMRTILQQRNEQQAVLTSMVEGVVAVDARERILDLNGAAARLFEVDPGQARGRSLPEVVRNPQLQKLVSDLLSRSASAEGDFVLYGGEDRCIQAHGSVLRDAAGEAIGALVVLNDVTRLRRMEQMRRDFVANASHELKTPITALKGCVETLGDGGATPPEETRRFLGMMERQIERLEAIVEDLLRLSRVEHDAEQGRVVLAPAPLRPVLESAVQACAALAAEKRIEVALQCPGDLKAALNAPLLEQAVSNLIDNAVKYSDAGTRVDLVAAAEGGEAVIRVTDQGCGIEKKHLARIFERFYRVDAARSRSLGGTGLGLAIVRHVALAHRGRVSVESTPGVGSTFRIHLPPAG